MWAWPDPASGGRLVAPLTGLGATLLAMDLARRLWADGGRAARLTPVLLLGCAFWAVFTTLTMFDCLLACCVLIGMHGVAAAGLSGGRRGWTRLALGARRWAILLAKGPVVLLHLLPALLLAPWWTPWRAGAPAVAALVRAAPALAVAARRAARPGLGAAGGRARRPGVSATPSCGEQTAGRIAGDASAPELNPHARPWWWYLPLLPVLLFPWSVWPPLWRAAARWRALRDDGGARLLALWLASAFAAFCAIGGKQVHYLIPLLPALRPCSRRAR